MFHLVTATTKKSKVAAAESETVNNLIYLLTSFYVEKNSMTT